MGDPTSFTGIRGLAIQKELQLNINIRTVLPNFIGTSSIDGLKALLRTLELAFLNASQPASATKVW